MIELNNYSEQLITGIPTKVDYFIDTYTVKKETVANEPQMRRGDLVKIVESAVGSGRSMISKVTAVADSIFGICTSIRGDSASILYRGHCTARIDDTKFTIKVGDILKAKVGATIIPKPKIMNKLKGLDDQGKEEDAYEVLF